MLRLFAVSLLMTGLCRADEPAEFRLAAPDGWGGETSNFPRSLRPR